MTSEQLLEEFLIRNLDLIDPKLSLIRSQYPTKYGKLDLFCSHSDGYYVVIELKTFADTNSPGQLAKYVFAIKEEYPTISIKGILVSENIPSDVCELCTHFNLTFKELNDLNLTEEKPPSFKVNLSMNRINKIKSNRLKRDLLKRYKISKN